MEALVAILVRVQILIAVSKKKNLKDNGAVLLFQPRALLTKIVATASLLF